MLDDILDAAVVGLGLPATKVGAVIFESDGPSCHMRILELFKDGVTKVIDNGGIFKTFVVSSERVEVLSAESIFSVESVFEVDEEV